MNLVNGLNYSIQYFLQCYLNIKRKVEQICENIRKSDSIHTSGSHLYQTQSQIHMVGCRGERGRLEGNGAEHVTQSTAVTQKQLILDKHYCIQPRHKPAR